MDLGSRYTISKKKYSVEEERIRGISIKQYFSLKYIVNVMVLQEFITFGYIPFYILYYILMALHIQFANTALGLGRRYRRLNNALTKAFPFGT